MFEIKFEVKKQPEYEYGQKLYYVKATKSKWFSEKCPVCDDTNKISYRGFDLDCPYCRTRSSAKCIIIHKFEITECIVNKVTIEGDEVKGLYKKGESPNPKVAYGAFSREGNSYDGVLNIQLWNKDLDMPEDKIIEQLKFKEIDRYIFTSKRGAEFLCDELIKREKEILSTFNKEHGTEYAYPFE